MELKSLQNIFIQKYLTKKSVWIYILSGGFVLGASLLALFISSVTVPIHIILHVIIEKIIGVGWLQSMPENVPDNVEMIIWQIRLPRVLLAFGVGAALSLAGAAFQGLLRNPLADPYTIGVSSGAALGAVIVLFFNISMIGLGMFTLPLFAILGGFITLFIVFGLTWLSSRSFAIETIILAGIIISTFLGALISLIIALSGEELRQIIYWLMGSLGMRGWKHLHLFVPFFIVGALLILPRFQDLNALTLGEEAAQHIGVHVQRSKMIILVGASLLTGAAVAVSGMIGFVGLVIPHVVRLLIGPNHKHVLPLSMLIGGGFLVLADLIARIIIAPAQLPIGVITAIIGAPVFALLLLKGSGRRMLG